MQNCSVAMHEGFKFLPYLTEGRKFAEGFIVTVFILKLSTDFRKKNVQD